MFNTGSQNYINSYAVYQINNSFNFSVNQPYSIKYQFTGLGSLKNFINDIGNFNIGGFDDFGRFLLGILITMLIVGGLNMQSGFNDVDVLIPAVIIMTLFFSYIGWFMIPNIGTIVLPTISNLPSNWLNQYIVFILVFLLGGGYIARRHL